MASPEQHSSLGKRLRSDSKTDLPSSPKRKSFHNVVFRIIVPSNQIGKIIGSKGTRIQKIREETKATVKIADEIQQHEERVIIISSKDGESNTSDAENALEHIASIILKEDDSVEPSKVGVGHVVSNMIRLLIAGSQAGCIIGKSGQNIAILRTSTGASVTISADTHLPLCASAHESDRVIQISGEVPEVLEALKQVNCQLRESAPRKVISVRPAHAFTSNNLIQPHSAPYSGCSILQLTI